MINDGVTKNEHVYIASQAVRLEIMQELLTDILLYGAYHFDDTNVDFRDNIVNPDEMRVFRGLVDSWLKEYRRKIK